MSDQEDFQVGEIVQLIDGDSYPRVMVGERGVVREVVPGNEESHNIGVEWFCYTADRHDLSGRCRDGHGWYVKARELKLIWRMV